MSHSSKTTVAFANMRNRFAGTCYRCNGHVPKGAGHFEKIKGGWRVQHADCAITHRDLKNRIFKQEDNDQTNTNV